MADITDLSSLKKELERIDSVFQDNSLTSNSQYSESAALSYLDSVLKGTASIIEANGFKLPYTFLHQPYMANFIIWKYDKGSVSNEAIRVFNKIGNATPDKDQQGHIARLRDAIDDGIYDSKSKDELNSILNGLLSKGSSGNNATSANSKGVAVSSDADRSKGRRIDKYYQTFAGTDMVAHIVFPNHDSIALGEVSTVTYSIYREKNPVRTLGSINTRGFTKGPRTIAGTIIFTVFMRHVVNRLRREVPYLHDLVKIKPDELPPFDIIISLGNEYGAAAWLGIFGITVVDEGKVFSVEDMFTENQWSYLAHDIYLMDCLGHPLQPPVIHQLRDEFETTEFDPNTLVLERDYVKMQEDINAYQQSMNEANAAALERFRQAQETRLNTAAELKAQEIANDMLYNSEDNLGWAVGKDTGALDAYTHNPDMFEKLYGEFVGRPLDDNEKEILPQLLVEDRYKELIETLRNDPKEHLKDLLEGEFRDLYDNPLYKPILDTMILNEAKMEQAIRDGSIDTALEQLITDYTNRHSVTGFVYDGDIIVVMSSEFPPMAGTQYASGGYTRIVRRIDIDRNDRFRYEKEPTRYGDLEDAPSVDKANNPNGKGTTHHFDYAFHWVDKTKIDEEKTLSTYAPQHIATNGQYNRTIGYTQVITNSVGSYSEFVQQYENRINGDRENRYWGTNMDIAGRAGTWLTPERSQDFALWLIAYLNNGYSALSKIKQRSTEHATQTGSFPSDYGYSTIEVNAMINKAVEALRRDSAGTVNDMAARIIDIARLLKYELCILGVYTTRGGDALVTSYSYYVMSDTIGNRYNQYLNNDHTWAILIKPFAARKIQALANRHTTNKRNGLAISDPTTVNMALNQNIVYGDISTSDTLGVDYPFGDDILPDFLGGFTEFIFSFDISLEQLDFSKLPRDRDTLMAAANLIATAIENATVSFAFSGNYTAKNGSDTLPKRTVDAKFSTFKTTYFNATTNEMLEGSFSGSTKSTLVNFLADPANSKSKGCNIRLRVNWEESGIKANKSVSFPSNGVVGAFAYYISYPYQQKHATKSSEINSLNLDIGFAINAQLDLSSITGNSDDKHSILSSVSSNCNNIQFRFNRK